MSNDLWKFFELIACRSKFSSYYFTAHIFKVYGDNYWVEIVLLTVYFCRNCNRKLPTTEVECLTKKSSNCANFIQFTVCCVELPFVCFLIECNLKIPHFRILFSCAHLIAIAWLVNLFRREKICQQCRVRLRKREFERR